MRTDIILNQLFEASDPIASSEIAAFNHISERTVRNEIRNLNEIGKSNGFQVVTKRNAGYFLEIEEYQKFLNYFSPSIPKIDVNNIEQRIIYILLMLFQAKGFIRIEDITKELSISRSTVVKDLNRICHHLSKYQLKLERKAHYGIKIIGDEQNYRRAISKVLERSRNQLAKTEIYKEFSHSIHINRILDFLAERIQYYQLNISDVAFKSIIEHIRILAFRTSRKNFIKKMEHSQMIEDDFIQSTSFQLSQDICDFLSAEYHIKIPENETVYLAEHIIGKTFTNDFSYEEKAKLKKRIQEILTIIDDEFITNFANDDGLVTALLMHTFPLLKRLHFNLQLENPIIEEVYSRYEYVFNIAIRFINLLNEDYQMKVSKDEIGYLAIYFAANLEKEKIKKLERFKKIAVICSTGGGAAYLIKMKLEAIFKEARIDTESSINLKKVIQGNYDLILSMVPIETEKSTTPIIKISNFLDDDEIERIENILALTYEPLEKSNSPNKRIFDLFYEELFQIKDGPEDYLLFLNKESKKLVTLGYALRDFPQKVHERETRMTTIYKNGVASPHSIEMGAKKECISVTIFKNPIIYQNKSVQLLFLINLKKGHLYLHKEISQLLLNIIENHQIRAELLKAKSYRQFIQVMTSLV